MLKVLKLVIESFIFALKSVFVNKLRTSLSLLGHYHRYFRHNFGIHHRGFTGDQYHGKAFHPWAAM